MKSIILIIDPGLKNPCVEAVNCISKIVGELKESSDFAFSHVEYVSLFLNNIRLKDFIQNKNIGAVVCLGSIANMTDKLSYVDNLISDLERTIFKNNTPFFGICFSHQMFAASQGFKVDFLKDAHKYYKGKHHLFREFQILHPKLSLLATKFEATDYFSENKIDLEFKNAVQVTKNWGKEQWDILSSARDWILTALENRVKLHITNNTAKSIVSHARHEQEIWEREASCFSEVDLAGKSDLCAFEALVHNCKPIFTVQTHPETGHELCGGYLLLKNFIYMASIIHSSQ